MLRAQLGVFGLKPALVASSGLWSSSVVLWIVAGSPYLLAEAQDLQFRRKKWATTSL